MTPVRVLVIGAGPFGLSLAGYLATRGIDHVLVGRPMQFWRSHMPRGMLLRSGCDWHYDPLGIDTIEAYLATRGQTPADVEPLSLDTYLGHAEWFLRRKGLEVSSDLVTRLDRVRDRDGDSDGDGHAFVATLASGATLRAQNVVLAPGFEHFPNVPESIAERLPAARWVHTRDAVDLARYAGRRVLVVGGRQSAFETAALLHDGGASGVDVCYRHDTPRFTASDWSWFTRKIDEIVDDPAWFRRLPVAEKEAINRRFWEEGRLKLEPWLGPRIAHESIRLWPHNEVASCEVGQGDEMSIRLTGGECLRVDDVILATGYKVDLSRIPLLAAGNLLEQLETRDGFPCLDERMQTSVPGFFITSMPATRDFGSFFAFTISVRASARWIGDAVA